MRDHQQTDDDLALDLARGLLDSHRERLARLRRIASQAGREITELERALAIDEARLYGRAPMPTLRKAAEETKADNDSWRNSPASSVAISELEKIR